MTLIEVVRPDVSKPCAQERHAVCVAGDVCACPCHLDAPLVEPPAPVSCCNGHGWTGRRATYVDPFAAVCREHLDELTNRWLDDAERAARGFRERAARREAQ